jgi:hypothetical protein
MPRFARLKNATSYLNPTEPAGNRNRRILLAIGAALLIAATLAFAGFTPVIIGCVVVTGIVIFVAVRRRARRETELIFTFYVMAEEVLRDGDGRRYRFEVSDVIAAGKKAVGSMPDPPPLGSFALGALHGLIGDHNAVVEYLGIAAEEEVLKDSTHVSPSRKLRRYVKRLRQIERFPQRWPKLYAAIGNLEILQRERAPRLLATSQQHLKKMIEAYENEEPGATAARATAETFSGRSLRSITPPPPISEVLNDVYQEEQPS